MDLNCEFCSLLKLDERVISWQSVPTAHYSEVLLEVKTRSLNSPHYIGYPLDYCDVCVTKERTLQHLQEQRRSWLLVLYASTSIADVADYRSSTLLQASQPLQSLVRRSWLPVLYAHRSRCCLWSDTFLTSGSSTTLPAKNFNFYVII